MISQLILISYIDRFWTKLTCNLAGTTVFRYAINIFDGLIDFASSPPLIFIEFA